MAAKLSDRIIDSSKDVLQKILETDMVQKFLMTGELNEKNRAVAQRFYKNLTDLTPFSQKMFKESAKLSGLTPEEKGFYEKSDEQFAHMYSKFLDELKAEVSPVPDDVMSAPIRSTTLEYQNLFTGQLEKGSVIHCLVASLTGYAVPVAIYHYLVKSPSYKENNLAKLLTFSTLGAEQALDAFKAFIDNRANEVTPELESELKALYKNINEFQLSAIITQYNEA